jgi:hypothetical protein
MAGLHGFDHFFRTPDLDRRIAAMILSVLALLGGAGT